MNKYVYDKNKLPVPVLCGHEDWLSIYYKAWELAFSNVAYIEKENWKPLLTCYPGLNTVWQWDSCIMTFITNYSNGTISAFNNLDNIYRLRRESDGFIGMAYSGNGVPSQPLCAGARDGRSAGAGRPQA